RFPVSQWLETETRIAMEAKALDVGVTHLGEPSLFTCPECHGTLLRLNTDGGGLRFRCHTGHAFTAAALLADLTESVEDALWNAVRSVEESSLLMQHLASHLREDGNEGSAALYELKAAAAGQRAELVKRVVMQHEIVNPDTLSELQE